MALSLPVVARAVEPPEASLTLVRPGNSKLGPGVWSWSIPAVHTCPGRTGACEAACYAAGGFFTTASVREALNRNLAATRAPGFAAWMAGQVARTGCRAFRVHVAGDFYSPAYLWDWVAVCSRLPGVTFFAWTRSWRLGEFRPGLEALAARPNVWLWYSADAETGRPTKVPPRARTAYMLLGGEAGPAFRTDLVFRDGGHRPGEVLKRVGGVMVCSAEQGVAHREPMTCTRCKVCLSPPRG